MGEGGGEGRRGAEAGGVGGGAEHSTDNWGRSLDPIQNSKVGSSETVLIGFCSGNAVCLRHIMRIPHSTAQSVSDQ